MGKKSDWTGKVLEYKFEDKTYYDKIVDGSNITLVRVSNGRMVDGKDMVQLYENRDEVYKLDAGQVQTILSLIETDIEILSSRIKDGMDEFHNNLQIAHLRDIMRVLEDDDE